MAPLRKEPAMALSPVIKRLTLGRVRDIALIVMAVSIIGVCAALGVLLLILYPSVQLSISNLETASESAVVATDNLATASQDIVVIAANLKSASASVAAAFARVEEASENIDAVVDNIDAASEDLKAASDALAERITAALADFDRLPGLFRGGN